ncbi:hypothetical protein B0A52_07588 [Exophiala mesophila]|uniref:Uncharacterized protein n=1 Tax=Exophiala mesophila TaxID=212818 RepID=A0A438MY72_EXOME|nr:hypothetical protein B0A52_07588 [Exophiala mesophila]
MSESDPDNLYNKLLLALTTITTACIVPQGTALNWVDGQTNDSGRDLGNSADFVTHAHLGWAVLAAMYDICLWDVADTSPRDQNQKSKVLLKRRLTHESSL